MFDKIQLETSCVLNAPLQSYLKDFTFIVNDEKFKTNIFVAHLLSPAISKLYLSDPTMNEYIIKTKERGNFQKILDLVNFNILEIQENERSFILDVFDQLQNDKITITINEPEITLNNVLPNLILHQRHKYFNQLYQKEVGFISEHFFELSEEQTNQFSELSIFTLISIFTNPKLLLQTEDQLLKIITYLYSQDHNYSQLFDYVDFFYCDSSSISEFLSIFEINDLSNEVWLSLSSRLKQQYVITKEENQARRHKAKNNSMIPENAKIFKFEDVDFNGIFNYLLKKSNGNIENEVKLSASSVLGQGYKLTNAFDYQKNNYYMSKSEENPWICFDFKEHQIILTNYTIRSYNGAPDQHPKSWVIEGSNDVSEWDIIDDKKDCPALNGNHIIHTFSIQNQKQKKYKYIRMKQTGPNWTDGKQLLIDSIEFYGTFI